MVRSLEVKFFSLSTNFVCQPHSKWSGDIPEHNENVILVKYKGFQDFYSYRHEASSRTLPLEVDDGILGWSLTVLEPEWTSTGPFEDVHVLDGVQEIVP